MYYMKKGLDIFKQVPKEIVFAIENAVTKKVYVNETKNGLFGVARLIHENPELLELDGQLVVHMLETDETYRRHYAAAIMDKYASEGYELINQKKPLQLVKSRIVFLENKFKVILENNRKNFIVVGEFEAYPEAKDFYDTYYSKEIPFPLVTYL